MEDISRFVSKTLDNIGYSAELIKERRERWQERNRINQKLHGTHIVSSFIVGSKAEGITFPFENDIDEISLSSNIICTNNVEAFSTRSRTMLFYTDATNTSPGYTKLKLIKGKRHGDRLINESLFMQRSAIFASSSLYASALHRSMLRDLGPSRAFKDLSGPAVTHTFGVWKSDCVFGVHCIHTDILLFFRTRPRQHDWPPISILQDDSSILCQLVPVGCKGSCNQWMEWRFCFLGTELTLTKSFNDTQIKIYVLLKFVAKDILKCVSNEISSYIMKNITYWVSELLDSRVFQEQNLMLLLLIGLKFLKEAIDSNRLPYYMITGRNLIFERLNIHTRRRLSHLLSYLLQEGPQFLLRCNKLRIGLLAMHMVPITLKHFGNKRELLESLFLLSFNVFILERHGCRVGNVRKQLWQKMFNIVLPEWKQLQRRTGNDIFWILNDRIVRVLS